MKKQFNITVQDLIEVGTQFGHRDSSLHPSMYDYVYGTSNGVCILDLDKTLDRLRKVSELMETMGEKKKTVLLIGTKEHIRNLIEEIAQSVGFFYINKRWSPGTLTNFKTLLDVFRKYNNIKTQLESDKNKIENKNVTKYKRKINKIESLFTGINKMNELPDLVIIVDVKHESKALLEAKKCKIPIIGIVDSDSDFNSCDYPIPGNDDSTKSINIILKELQEAYTHGIKNTVSVRKTNFRESSESKYSNSSTPSDKKDIKSDNTTI